MSVASAETAGSSRFGVVLAGCLTALTIPLSIASPAVGIPAIRDALGGSPAALSWIINAYLLTYGCTTLVAGGLADLHGRRRIWILGGALFALVTGLIPLMPDVAWINVLRLLQGMAASAAFAGAMASLAQVFDGQARARVFSLIGTTFGAGAAGGPLLAGGLIDALGWEWVFFLPALLAALTVPLVALSSAESRNAGSPRLDWLGAITFMLALTGKIMVKDKLARQGGPGFAARGEHMGVGLVGRTLASSGIADLYGVAVLGIHRPKMKTRHIKTNFPDQVKWLNGSGREMEDYFKFRGWRSITRTVGYDWVQLNHYAVRSAESFLVKRDRGRVNHVDRDQGLNYWFRMNHNPVVDTSIQRMIPALQAEFDRLMADPEIRAAHEHSVTCHVDKIKELRATENYEKFYGELCSERFEKLSRMLHVFGSNVFGAGPNVLPEDIHTRDLPPDFFFTVEHQGEAEH